MTERPNRGTSLKGSDKTGSERASEQRPGELKKPHRELFLGDHWDAALSECPTSFAGAG